MLNVRRDEILDGVTALIGNTPLVRIKSLSELTGCEIIVSTVTHIKDTRILD